MRGRRGVDKNATFGWYFKESIRINLPRACSAWDVGEHLRQWYGRRRWRRGRSEIAWRWYLRTRDAANFIRLGASHDSVAATSLGTTALATDDIRPRSALLVSVALYLTCQCALRFVREDGIRVVIRFAANIRVVQWPATNNGTSSSSFPIYSRARARMSWEGELAKRRPVSCVV
jgi:hypothetical protein